MKLRISSGVIFYSRKWGLSFSFRMEAARKVVGRGRPSGETPKAVINYIRSLALSPFPKEDPHPQFLSSSAVNKLLCFICCEVAANPVSLSCRETICSQCCCESIQVAYSLNCPCCFSHTLNSETISAAPPLFMSLLSELLVSCIRRCGKTIKIQDYQRHLDSRCKSYMVNTDSPSKVTLKDIFRKLLIHLNYMNTDDD